MVESLTSLRSYSCWNGVYNSINITSLETQEQLVRTIERSWQKFTKIVSFHIKVNSFHVKGYVMFCSSCCCVGSLPCSNSRPLNKSKWKPLRNHKWHRSFLALPCGNSRGVRGSPFPYKYGKAKEVGCPKWNSLCGGVWIFSGNTFWIPNANGILDSLRCIPDSKVHNFEFREKMLCIFQIPDAKISRIPESGFPYSATTRF